ncbi:hypothetical protein D3C87_1429980 [compost metagenome]
MKTTYFLLIILCLAGCSLFKKTTKTSTKSGQSSRKQTEQNQLILKRADKETHILTYWNDSGLYQFQHIKEQIDQAKSGQLKTKETQEVKQHTKAKEIEPVKIWIYVGILVVLICFSLLYKVIARKTRYY